jgi:hypothetical protein
VHLPSNNSAHSSTGHLIARATRTHITKADLSGFRPQTPFPPPSWLVHVNGFVDLLPLQWSPLGTSDAKHANGVAVDQEDDAVDVWLLAKKASSRGTP